MTKELYAAHDPWHISAIQWKKVVNKGNKERTKAETFHSITQTIIHRKYNNKKTININQNLYVRLEEIISLKKIVFSDLTYKVFDWFLFFLKLNFLSHLTLFDAHLSNKATRSLPLLNLWRNFWVAPSILTNHHEIIKLF